jgi:hypothetical protein
VVTVNQIQVYLSKRERKLFGLSNFTIDQSQITSVKIGGRLDVLELGNKVSRKSMLGGFTGDYRAGEIKTLVLGNPRSLRHLIVKLKHPTIDVIIYCSNDADFLNKKLRAHD